MASDTRRLGRVIPDLSQEQKQNYYAGLLSHSTLITSSSLSLSPSPTPKTLKNVGQHPIVDLWNKPQSLLKRRIIQAVKYLPWISIDILRIGPGHYARDDFPVVMFITVDSATGSTLEGMDMGKLFPAVHGVGWFCRILRYMTLMLT
jgi:hypothetical protein